MPAPYAFTLPSSLTQPNSNVYQYNLAILLIQASDTFRAKLPINLLNSAISGIPNVPACPINS